MTRSLPAAVLFDMDGTIVDTEPYWLDAEADLVAQFGGLWSAEDGLDLVGQGLGYSAATLQRRGVELSTEVIIARLTDRVLARTMQEIPWRPGALELLLAVRDAGIPTALVTMSMPPLAEFIALSSTSPLFDIIVTGNDVSKPKPHPEPYLRAAELLGVDIRECVAIEDSIPGLTSAAAAGAAVVGIPAHVELTENDAWTLWPTLSGATIEDLAGLARANVSRPTSEEEPR